MAMYIIGGGMAGLLAAHYFRHYNPTVIESQKTLPNNHRALLRFGTREVGKIANVDFEEVYVRKQIVCDGQFADQPNTYLCNQYSLKVTGKVSNRSIWNIDPGFRYIAPEDFIQKLANGVDIQLGCTVNREMLDKWSDNMDYVISTIPMPTMMDIVGWNRSSQFKWRKIWSTNVWITVPDVQVCQTIYYPSIQDPVYRASLVRNRLIIEYTSKPENVEDIIRRVLTDFGIPPQLVELDIDDSLLLRQQDYGKIIPTHDEFERQEFIYWMTREFRVYSLGRFATWRQILLDELPKDLEVIRKLINVEYGSYRYKQKLHGIQH